MEHTGPSTIAIEQLYNDYYRPIQCHLVRLVSHQQTAEDLAQETFIKALRSWDQLDKVTNARAWLYRVATNTAYDYLRRRRLVRITPLIDEHTTALTAPAMETRLDNAEPIRAALQGIPEHYRLPMLLASAGYEYKDIAAVLGVNVNTIKTRVHRGRAHFRQLYQPN